MTGLGGRLTGLLLAAMLALAPLTASAVMPDERLADPALEARARALSAELRCLVCQNQSIDDSEADLARDLRILVRDRLKAGDSDAEVLDYLVDRYGEFVLLKPRLEWHTLILWAIGPGLLVVGGAAAFLAYRRRRQAAEPAGLSADEEARLVALMKEDAADRG